MADSRRHRNFRKTLELVTAVLLSLGGAATTYCSYQASLWGGRQAASYSRAGAARTESVKAATLAGQLTTIDVSTFLAWLQADAGGQIQLEERLRERLRRPFKPIFDAWLATDPLHSPNAPPTPFAMPEYLSPEQARAEALAKQ